MMSLYPGTEAVQVKTVKSSSVTDGMRRAGPLLSGACDPTRCQTTVAVGLLSTPQDSSTASPGSAEGFSAPDTKRGPSRREQTDEHR